MMYRILNMLNGDSAIDIGLFLVVYVLFSFGVMQMMEYEGRRNRILAWIPVVGNFVLGKILEREIGKNKAVWNGVTPWILAVGTVISLVPEFGALFVVLIGIYLIVLNTILGNKYRFGIGMFVCSLVGLSGIGYIILSGRMLAKRDGNY